MKPLLLTRYQRLHKKKELSCNKELHDANNHPLNYRCYTSPVFGRTLEVCLVPSKICAFDCIYCPHGRTTQKSIDYIDPALSEEAINDLHSALLTNREIDHIVIGGKGDPALYDGLSSVIKNVRVRSPVKVAVISCGGLLWKPNVQADLANADIVMASLDSPDKTLYQSISRPHAMVPFKRFFNGMLEFRRQFRGAFWLQVTLLDGINGSENDVRKIAKLAQSLNPDRTFIRTVPGEPAEDFAFPIEHSRLQNLAPLFGTKAAVINSDEIAPLPVGAHDGLPLGMHD